MSSTEVLEGAQGQVCVDMTVDELAISLAQNKTTLNNASEVDIILQFNVSVKLLSESDKNSYV